MNNNEKMLLLDLLLQDIRGNWGWENEDRTGLARKLAEELSLKSHVQSLSDYEAEGKGDGRFFRTSMKNGGYRGLKTTHGLNYTYHDRSEKFKKLAKEYLTHPKYAFDDWSQ